MCGVWRVACTDVHVIVVTFVPATGIVCVLLVQRVTEGCKYGTMSRSCCLLNLLKTWRLGFPSSTELYGRYEVVWGLLIVTRDGKITVRVRIMFVQIRNGNWLFWSHKGWS